MGTRLVPCGSAQEGSSSCRMHKEWATPPDCIAFPWDGATALMEASRGILSGGAFETLDGYKHAPHCPDRRSHRPGAVPCQRWKPGSPPSTRHSGTARHQPVPAQETALLSAALKIMDRTRRGAYLSGVKLHAAESHKAFWRSINWAVGVVITKPSGRLIKSSGSSSCCNMRS